MTQTDIPAWLLELQFKMITALDAAWKVVDGGGDSDDVREALDKAKAIGQLAMIARKVGMIIPSGRKPLMDAATAGLLATKSVADVGNMIRDLMPPTAPVAPVAAQAEHARRALDKLKGGRRGRL
jgi:hypothetical protein